MKVKEWVVENLAFLIAIVFAMVAFYTTFQIVLYRMDQVEAQVDKMEEIILPQSEFNTLKEQVNRIEDKLDRLLEK